MRRNPWSKIRKTKITGRIRSRSSGKEKNKVTPRSQTTMLLMSLKKRKRIEIVISVESRIITATKKAILQIPALSQKTSVGFGNLYADD